MSRRQPLNAKARRARRALMLSLQGGQCFWCPTPLDLTIATLDELIPRSRGGTQRLGNVVVACEPCNNQRGNGNASVSDIARAAALVSARVDSV